MINQTITDPRNTTLTLDDDDSSLTITWQGSIVTSNTNAVTETVASSGNTIAVNGLLWSSDAKALFSAGAGTQITIGAFGLLGGFYALHSTGNDVRIENAGRVTANATIEAIVSEGARAHIENSGVISGYAGIALAGEDVTLVNAADGLVIGRQLGVGFYGTAESSVSHITNHGTFQGSTYSFSGYDGKEVVINDGLMKGDVYLGRNDDTFNNRGGRVVGNIYGNDGDDTFFVDKAGTPIIEAADEGFDTVKSTATFTLGENFEYLVLLGTANLRGTGNALANRLIGNTGDNILSGLDGQDKLDGGKGNDNLNGGGDADTFIFWTGNGKDVVKDFEDGGDVLDLGGWKAVTTFANLETKHTLESHGDLIISFGTDQLTIENMTKEEFDSSDVVL